MLRYSLLFFIVLFFVGCEHMEVKKFDQKLLDTDVGTIKDQKLITKLPQKEPKNTLTEKKNVNTSVAQKKQKFKDILVPIVTEVYNQLQKQFEMVRDDIIHNRNQQFINELKEYYEVKNNEELLKALKPHPVSITLAQGAIESAWLTSRFSKVANNIFGVWSFREEDDRIEATGMRGEKKIYLKKYKNLKAAVYDYYKNIAKNWAYDEFRANRLTTNDPYKLVEHLGSYSEKKERYVKLLKKMIEYNKFDQYDIKKPL
jgi:Bax protein